MLHTENCSDCGCDENCTSPLPPTLTEQQALWRQTMASAQTLDDAADDFMAEHAEDGDGEPVDPSYVFTWLTNRSHALRVAARDVQPS